MLTETRRRPSDDDKYRAELEVITAARAIVDHGSDPDTAGLGKAVRQLQDIEKRRAEHPAVIPGERLSGWDRLAVFEAVEERVGQNGSWFNCGYELEGDRCPECNDPALRSYRCVFPFPEDKTPRNLAVCDACGFTYEW